MWRLSDLQTLILLAVIIIIVTVLALVWPDR